MAATVQMAGRISILQAGRRGVQRSRATLGMPDGAALDEHFFAVTEQVATFRTLGAGRVEVVVVARLQGK